MGDVDDVSSEGLAAQDKTAFSQPLLNDSDIDKDAIIVNPLPFATPAMALNPPVDMDLPDTPNLR